MKPPSSQPLVEKLVLLYINHHMERKNCDDVCVAISFMLDATLHGTFHKAQPDVKSRDFTEMCAPSFHHSNMVGTEPQHFEFVEEIRIHKRWSMKDKKTFRCR